MSLPEKMICSFKSNDLKKSRTELQELVRQTNFPSELDIRKTPHQSNRDFAAKQAQFLLDVYFTEHLYRKLKTRIKNSLIDNLLVILKDKPPTEEGIKNRIYNIELNSIKFSHLKL